MKAIINKKTIVVYESDIVTTFIYTDIPNIAYCLARILDCKLGYGYIDMFLELLRRKTMRGVIQKFNAICRALDLR